jgi:hypothetical protein
MASNISDVIDKQIRAWSHDSSADQKGGGAGRYKPVITISREFGSRGAALAAVLSKKTGFKLWDKELLEAISDDLGSDKKFVETLDERRQRVIEETVAGFLTNVHTNVSYLRSLIRVVSTIEQHGSGIVVGRGANFICERKDTLHVRIVSPIRERVSEYARRNKIGRTEATRIIEDKDRERADFILNNFHKDVTDPSIYDLVLNSHSFSIEQLADIIIRAYTVKTGVEIPVKSVSGT